MSERFKFSLFANAYDRSPQIITLSEFEEMIAGGDWSERVIKVRTLTGGAKTDAKEKMPVVTVSGVFVGGHSASKLVGHSGLICMDFDLKGNPLFAGGLDAIREQLAEDQYSALAFVSVGGKGLAVICKIDPEYHKESFEWLCEYYLDQHGLVADKSCGNVNRLRFVSWDADAQLTKAKQSCYVGGVVRLPTLHTLHNTPLLRLSMARDYIKQFETKDHHPLYQKLIRKFPAKPGQRNETLATQLIPFLYGAVSEPIAMEWVEAFYWYNAGIFNAPIDKHMKAARDAWNTCANNYTNYLTPTEHEYYSYIADMGTEEELTLFRICRSLSLVDDPDLPVGTFALSAEKCRFRIGLKHDPQGSRLIDKLYKQYGVLELIKGGTMRSKGQRGRANTWLWTIGESEEEAA